MGGHALAPQLHDPQPDVGSREAPLKLDGPHAQGTETNNFCTQDDPGFVDWKGGDYRLKPDAEAYRRIEGFEPLPIERMGVYEDEYRKPTTDETYSVGYPDGGCGLDGPGADL